MTGIPSWLTWLCRDPSAITAQSQAFHLWVATFSKDTIGGGLWWGSFCQIEIQKMTKLTPDFRVSRVEKLRKLCIFNLFQCLGVWRSSVIIARITLQRHPMFKVGCFFHIAKGGASDAELVLGRQRASCDALFWNVAY
jgi:hypothetical protein